MRRWQSKFHPRLKLSGKTLEEIHKSFEESDHSEFTKYAFDFRHSTVESSLKTKLIKVGEQNHMIINDSQFITNIDDTEYLFLDGTFSIVPRIKNVKQLSTIMVQKVEKVLFIRLY